jgi:hypothetical protein
MSNTAYGQSEEQKMREVGQGYQKMSAAEKELLKQKMAWINEADTGNGESCHLPLPLYR